MCCFSSAETPVTWADTLARMAQNAASYLPKQTSEVLTQDRSFATVHLTSGALKTTIGMNT